MLIYDPMHKIHPALTDIDFVACSPGAKSYVMVIRSGSKTLDIKACPDGWYEAKVPEMTPEEIKKALAKVNNVDPSEIELVPR